MHQAPQGLILLGSDSDSFCENTLVVMQYRKRCEKASPSAIYRLFQSVFLQLPHDRRLVDLQLFSDFTRCTAGLLRVGQDLQL